MATVAHAGDFKPLNCGAAVGLGEVHFTEHKAIVVIQTGLKDESCTNDTGGGMAIIDLESQMLEQIMPLVRSDAQDGQVSRIVHTYMDPAGTHLWLNDDGTSGDAAPDYVFRVNVDSMDTNGDGDDYLDTTAIQVGDGHKKSAFSYMNGTVMANPYFATHNLSDRTVSIINDPPNGSVVTRDLGVNNIPHGLDFSPTSGHFYVGITNGAENAVSIIDATNVDLPITHIPVGDAANTEIPAAGYVHAHGDKVYTVGYVAGHGYLSIIDATNDTVAQVIDLGDVSASSFNISHMEMDHGGMTHVEMKAWIPGRTVMNGTVPGTAINNVVKVVSLDHMTGLQEDGTEVRTVTIGVGGAHRNGKITPDGMHAIFPNGGDCTADHHSNPNSSCMTISVVDTMTETVIATVHTTGHEPGNIGIVDAVGVNGGAGGDGHNHTH